MSLVPFTTEDLPEAPERFLRRLNELVLAVEDLAAPGVEGLRAFTATVTVDAGHTFPLSVANKLGEVPAGVLVLSATDLTSKEPAAVSGAAWRTAGDQVQLTALAGLEAGHAYRVSLLVLGR